MTGMTKAEMISRKDELSEELATLEKKEQSIHRKLNLITARHEVTIFGDNELTAKMGYHQAETFRKAKVRLALAEDDSYHELVDEMDEVESKVRVVGSELESLIDKLYPELALEPFSDNFDDDDD